MALPRPQTADVLPVLALIALGFVPDPDVRQSAAATVLIPLPLLWRRRWPVAVWAIALGCALVRLVAEENSLTDLGVFLALYTVAAGRSTRVTVGTTVVTVGATLPFFGGHGMNEDAAGPLVGVLGLLAAAVAAGTVARTRRELVDSLEDRAHRLEIERDQERQLATAAERARISREMHDIVAHNLAVMVSLADGAANVATREPERAERAMQDVASTGRGALAEMRRLLGVLREEGDELRTPQPGLAQLPALLEAVRAAGLKVTAADLGDPEFTPSSGFQLAIYRIVQESLTNAIKHGGAAAAASVAIDWAGRRATVEITSTGAPVGLHRGDGGGLTGMRERAGAFNGAVEAGPVGDGRWSVCATLTDDPPG